MGILFYKIVQHILSISKLIYFDRGWYQTLIQNESARIPIKPLKIGVLIDISLQQ